MHISNKGLDIIKEFEGYEKALPDGRCIAYRCYVAPGVHDGKWTIGWGCTEGITEGTIWTREQAESGLRHEIVHKEQAVLKLLKFVPNQNQFDAMVSLTYNIGEGGFARSSVLSFANAGDFPAASRAFNLWNKSKGYVVGGLVRRRAKEAALFMELSEGEQALSMPQTVDAPAEALNDTGHNVQQTVAGTGIVGVLLTYLGLAPAQLLDFVKTYGLEITLGGCIVAFIISEIYKNFKGDK